jgi:hypothetical protein
MIKIKQVGKKAVHLILNIDGARLLLSRMNLPGDITIRLDESSLKITKRTVIDLKIIINDEDDRISFLGTTFVLELDSDTLEYFRKRLEDCLNGGDFSPAELCEASFGSLVISMYAILIK